METEQIIGLVQESGTELAINLVAAVAILLIGRWVAKLLHRVVI